MLAMLPNTIAVNQDILSNFRSRFRTNCCNCWWTIFEIFMQIRQWRRFPLKKRHPPPCRFAWKFQGKLAKLTIRVFWSNTLFWRNLRKFLKTSTVATQVDKICSRILWTWSAWHTCLGWYCNPQLL
jgi:hypothetical protein